MSHESGNNKRALERTLSAGAAAPHRFARTVAALALLSCFAMAGLSAGAAHAEERERPSWGAIASMGGYYGYGIDYGSRLEAEREALFQCGRKSGRPGGCVVRTRFNRSCGALAQGYRGRHTYWGAAHAPTRHQARKQAVAQCNSRMHLESCKVIVFGCSSH